MKLFQVDSLTKESFRPYQASARSGEMETELKDDCVLFKGHAVEVFHTD